PAIRRSMKRMRVSYLKRFTNCSRPDTRGGQPHGIRIRPSCSSTHLRKSPMARNTTVNADHNAPAITETLARFVAGHPSRGWSDTVDAEAHRTFANWAGCAIGPATHETVEAAMAAVMELDPAPQASVL